MIPASYIGVAAILVLTPGAGTMFLINATMAHGAAGARNGIMGMTLGAAVHIALASAGMSVVVERYPAVKNVIAVAGGAYLVYLGGRALRAAWRASGVPAPRASAGNVFVAGLLTNALNIPLALFYLVVVPQYVTPGSGVLAGMLLLSFVHLCIAVTWQLVLTHALDSVAHAVRSPRFQRAAFVASALTLLFFGVKSMGIALV